MLASKRMFGDQRRRGKLSSYFFTNVCSHSSSMVNRHVRSNKDMDPPFFLGDSSGTIFFADDAGHCTESLCLSEKISLMKFHDGRDLLLVLSEDLMFSHFLLNAEGKLILDTAVKIKINDSKSFSYSSFI